MSDVRRTESGLSVEPGRRRPAQLPSGKHGLPRRLVVRNQRDRILRALTVVVARDGYANATIRDICAQARLSRKTFYDNFTGKEECFLAAFDAAVDLIAVRVDAARRAHESWEAQICAALEAFIELVVAEPELARVCMLEVIAAGPRAQKRRDRAIKRFAGELLKLRRCVEPEDAKAPPLTGELVVGGLQQIVNARLADGRLDSLYEDLPEMVYCAVAPFGGHRRAADAAERARDMAPEPAKRRRYGSARSSGNAVAKPG